MFLSRSPAQATSVQRKSESVSFVARAKRSTERFEDRFAMSIPIRKSTKFKHAEPNGEKILVRKRFEPTVVFCEGLLLSRDWKIDRSNVGSAIIIHDSMNGLSRRRTCQFDPLYVIGIEWFSGFLRMQSQIPAIKQDCDIFSHK